MATYEGMKAKAEYLGGPAFEISQADSKAYADSLKVNATGQAVVNITYISTGVGQHRQSKPVIFPVVFRKEPHFTSGCATVKHIDTNVWHDPIGSCGLYAWKKDSAGNYIGAYVWTRVDIHPLDPANPDRPPANLTTQHYLTFTAVAGKDLPDATNAPSTAQMMAQLRDIGIASAFMASRTDT